MLQLRDADMYEVPVVVALLRLLSPRVAGRRAVQPRRCGVSQSRETALYFDRINLDGGAISLKGTGEMNLEREIDLNFLHAGGPRRRGSLAVGADPAVVPRGQPEHPANRCGGHAGGSESDAPRLSRTERHAAAAVSRRRATSIYALAGAPALHRRPAAAAAIGSAFPGPVAQRYDERTTRSSEIATCEATARCRDHEVHQDAGRRKRLHLRRLLSPARARSTRRARSPHLRSPVRSGRRRADPDPTFGQGRRLDADVQCRRLRGRNVRQRHSLRGQIRLRPWHCPARARCASKPAPACSTCRSRRPERLSNKCGSTWARRFWRRTAFRPGCPAARSSTPHWMSTAGHFR